VRRLALLLTLAAALAGCGDRASITGGGRVAGQILTVYTLLPREGPRAQAAADMVRGAKLALAQAGGRVGALTVQFATADEPVGAGGEVDEEAVATAVEEVVRDTGTIAVIGDLDARTARVSVPLLNAVGVLHLSPGTGATGFAQPAREPTFVSLVPSDAAQAAALARRAAGRVAVEAEGTQAAQALAEAVRARLGGTVATRRADTVVYAGSDPVNARGVVEGVLAENRRARVLLPQELATTDLARTLGPRVRALTAVPGTVPPGFAATFPGATPGPFVQAGWEAMRVVLAALRRAGPEATTRRAVVDAVLATHPRARADALFRLID